MDDIELVDDTFKIGLFALKNGWRWIYDVQETSDFFGRFQQKKRSLV